MYPDEQEILYQHIMSVLPDGRLPVGQAYPSNANTGTYALTDL